VIGLVPDGVATIDFTLARGRGLGLEGDRVYRTIYRRTAAGVDLGQDEVHVAELVPEVAGL
jgi:hypothetical protein